MKTAVAYLRRSTEDKQAQSLEIQKEQIVQFSQQNGISVETFYSDSGISGTKDIEDCAGLKAAICAAKGKDFFLVARIDRLSRNISKFYAVKQMVEVGKTKIVSVENGFSDGSDAALISEVFNTLQAQLYINNLKRRIVEGINKKKASGYKYSKNCPFGYRSDENNRLVEDEKEQSAIKEMKKLYSNGMNTLQIAKILSEQGYKSRKGTNISQATVYRIVKTR